jgi:hypothetical protein
MSTGVLSQRLEPLHNLVSFVRQVEMRGVVLGEKPVPNVFQILIQFEDSLKGTLFIEAMGS